jgi:GNAT superfamily N-acetyltransferase
MPPVEVVRTYLEMTSPDDLRAGSSTLPSDVTLRREWPEPARYRFLYAAVGDAHHWRDRNAWSDDDLAGYLRRASVSVWVLARGDDPLGYVELVRDDGDGSVEIAYFGLLPAAIGQGMGGAFLAEAVRRAWSLDATRVWLHTCTLDHPAALPNYLARGFRVTRTERYHTDLPRT